MKISEVRSGRLGREPREEGQSKTKCRRDSGTLVEVNFASYVSMLLSVWPLRQVLARHMLLSVLGLELSHKLMKQVLVRNEHTASV